MNDTTKPHWRRSLGRRGLLRQWGSAVVGATLALTLQTAPLWATTIPVTTSDPAIQAGDNKCSLSEALINANNDNQSGATDCPAGNGADTLVLAGGRYTISALHNNTDGPNGLPSITSMIVISGNGATLERAGTAAAFRILHVAQGGNLTLQQTTLTGGHAASSNLAARYHYGGALYNQGTVTLQSCTISGNQADLDGGGIANYGTLTVMDSTINGNVAGRDGGGVINNGFTHTSSVTLLNSTVSGNTAGRDGGALANFAYRSTGQLTVTQSTLTGNQATRDGGGLVTDATTTLARSIVSGNTAVTGAEVQRNGHTLNVNAFNLFGQNALTTAVALNNVTPGANDRVATSNGAQATALATILNGTLADNGGATQTHALPVGSPAIDVIPPAQCSDVPVDQRGVARPQGAACDIGALEFQATQLISPQLALQGAPSVLYQPTPDATFGPQSPAGVFTINATLVNTGTFHLHSIYYQVTRLDNKNYLLDTTGGPGGVAARQPVADPLLPGGNQRWDTQESLTAAFRIGLAERRRFGFFVDVYGLTDSRLTSAQTATANDIRLGGFYFEYDPNDFVGQVPGARQNFLPLLFR